MDFSSLQNPSDPDATYRKKAGKEHRGYAANITETVDVNGPVVTDYQYDVNTRSDVDFLQESIRKSKTTDDVTAIIADGAYASEDLAAQAAGKNIGLITTAFAKESQERSLHSLFFSEDGHTVTKCPEGHTPKRSSYIRQSESIRVSFPRCCCENCLHQQECNAKIKIRTALVILSLGVLAHTEEGKKLSVEKTTRR